MITLDNMFENPILIKAKANLKIKMLNSRIHLDSRGKPTLKTSIELVNTEDYSYVGEAAVPSGASVGSHEALELRDHDQSQYLGQGVSKAVNNVNSTMREELTKDSFTFSTLSELDNKLINLDNTANKSNLGANSILSVSMATARALAKANNLELFEFLRQEYFPNLGAKYKLSTPMANVINGGAHADNDLSVQEFMLVTECPTISEVIENNSTLYHTLKNQLKKDNYNTSLGDEGGFAPKMNSTDTVINYLENLLQNRNQTFGTSTKISLDVAASEFYNSETRIYTIDKNNFTNSQMVDFYEELISKHNILSIEDALAEDDLEGWKMLTERIGHKVMLIGDDLFVTNPIRLASIGRDKNIANAILIKPNQIGSITETCTVINMAKEMNYKVIISHRSGETCDSFITDLAVACNADYLKIGAPARGERTAKYNRLIDIDEILKYRTG